MEFYLDIALIICIYTNITFEAYLGPMLTKREKGYKEAVLEHF